MQHKLLLLVVISSLIYLSLSEGTEQFTIILYPPARLFDRV